MNWLFDVPAAVAIGATIMMVTRINAVHALLYLIVSLLAVAVIFFVIGAPFAAALEVIVYAGAIMVLFVFVIMLLNLGRPPEAIQRSWLTLDAWAGPTLLALALAAEAVYLLLRAAPGGAMAHGVEPGQVGLALFGPYLLAVELVSMLLLGGLVGAYHLGRDHGTESEE